MTLKLQPAANHFNLITTFLRDNSFGSANPNEQLLEKIREIETRKKIFEQQAPEQWAHNLEKLQVARAMGSKTLRTKPIVREHWSHAQLLIETWIHNEKPPNIEGICELHACLCGKAFSQLRMGDVFTGPTKHCNSHEVGPYMDELIQSIFHNITQAHPVLRAAVLRQWFLAIHPFEDANGRSSQLLADFILLQQGYLPQSFYQGAEGICGLIWGESQNVFMKPETAFFNFARSVLNSYSILGTT